MSTSCLKAFAENSLENSAILSRRLHLLTQLAKLRWTTFFLVTFLLPILLPLSQISLQLVGELGEVPLLLLAPPTVDVGNLGIKTMPSSFRSFKLIPFDILIFYWLSSL